MKGIKKTTAKNSLPATTNSPARKKYRNQQEEALSESRPQLSAAETRALARLVSDDKLRDIRKFRKTIKKTRQQGRQDLIDFLKAMLEAPLNKERRDLIEKLQHYQKQARPYRGRK